jgi:hypothetical protein
MSPEMAPRGPPQTLPSCPLMGVGKRTKPMGDGCCQFSTVGRSLAVGFVEGFAKKEHAFRQIFPSPVGWGLPFTDLRCPSVS